MLQFRNDMSESHRLVRGKEKKCSQRYHEFGYEWRWFFQIKKYIYTEVTYDQESAVGMGRGPSAGGHLSRINQKQHRSIMRKKKVFLNIRS